MIAPANQLDIVGKRNDGGIDLVIVAKGEIDSSAKTQNLLLDKVENYLGYILSKEFKKDFPGIDPKKAKIVLKTDREISKPIKMLCERIKEWTEKSGVQFEVQ